MDSGYIYVLINPMLPDLVKIGKTVKSPDERAKELSSSTGVPAPFFVAYQISVNNITEAESYFHQLFSVQRVNDGREFFNTPLHDVIKAMYEYHLSEQSDENYNGKIETKQIISSQKKSSNTLFSTYFITAEKYNYGLDGEIINKNEALSLYKKAAKLGSLDAYTRIGEIYSHGTDGPRKGVSVDKAKQFFFEGANKGAGACWAELGILAIAEGKELEADKCFLKYFTSDDWKKNHSEELPRENNLHQRNKYYYLFNYLFTVFSLSYDIFYEDIFKKINTLDSKIAKELNLNTASFNCYFKQIRKTYKETSSDDHSLFKDEDEDEYEANMAVHEKRIPYSVMPAYSREIDWFFEETSILDKRLITEYNSKIYKNSYRDVRTSWHIVKHVLDAISTKKIPVKLSELSYTIINYITSSIHYLMENNSILEFSDFYDRFQKPNNL